MIDVHFVQLVQLLAIQIQHGSKINFDDGIRSEGSCILSPFQCNQRAQQLLASILKEGSKEVQLSTLEHLALSHRSSATALWIVFSSLPPRSFCDDVKNSNNGETGNDGDVLRSLWLKVRGYFSVETLMELLIFTSLTEEETEMETCSDTDLRSSSDDRRRDRMPWVTDVGYILKTIRDYLRRQRVIGTLPESHAELAGSECSIGGRIGIGGVNGGYNTNATVHPLVLPCLLHILGSGNEHSEPDIDRNRNDGFFLSAEEYHNWNEVVNSLKALSNDHQEQFLHQWRHAMRPLLSPSLYNNVLASPATKTFILSSSSDTDSDPLNSGGVRARQGVKGKVSAVALMAELKDLILQVPCIGDSSDSSDSGSVENSALLLAAAASLLQKVVDGGEITLACWLLVELVELVADLLKRDEILLIQPQNGTQTPNHARMRCLMSLAVLSCQCSRLLLACCCSPSAHCGKGGGVAVVSDCVSVLDWVADRVTLLGDQLRFPCEEEDAVVGFIRDHSFKCLVLLLSNTPTAETATSETDGEAARMMIGERTHKTLLDILSRQMTVADMPAPLLSSSPRVPCLFSWLSSGGKLWLATMTTPHIRVMVQAETMSEAEPGMRNRTDACTPSQLLFSGLLQSCTAPGQLMSACVMAHALSASLSSSTLALCEIQCRIQQIFLALESVSRGGSIRVVVATLHWALVLWFCAEVRQEEQTKQSQPLREEGVTEKMLTVLEVVLEALPLAQVSLCALLNSLLMSPSTSLLAETSLQPRLRKDHSTVQSLVGCVVCCTPSDGPSLTVLACILLVAAKENSKLGIRTNDSNGKHVDRPDVRFDSARLHSGGHSRYEVVSYWLQQHLQRGNPAELQYIDLDIMRVFQHLGACVVGLRRREDSKHIHMPYISAGCLASVIGLVSVCTQRCMSMRPEVEQSFAATRSILTALQASLLDRKRRLNISNPASAFDVSVPGDIYFYTLAKSMHDLIVSQQHLHTQTNHVITDLRALCNSKSGWFMTYVINYFSFLAQFSLSGSIERDLSLCLQSEKLEDIIFKSSPSPENSSEAPCNAYEVLFPPLNDSFVLSSAWQWQHHALAVSPLQLSLLLRVEPPDTSHPSCKERFLFPNLIQRTLLGVLALQSLTTVDDRPYNERLTSDINEGYVRVVRSGIKSIFPPVLSRLWVMYMDLFLREGEKEGRTDKVVSLLKYVSVCLTLMSIHREDRPRRHKHQKHHVSQKISDEDYNENDISGEKDCYDVWTLSLVFCQPVRLKRIMTHLMGGEKQSQSQSQSQSHSLTQKYTAHIVLCSAELLLTLPHSTPGILCPTLTLCALCNIMCTVAPSCLFTRASRMKLALGARVRRGWQLLSTGVGDLCQPPLSCSIFSDCNSSRDRVFSDRDSGCAHSRDDGDSDDDGDLEDDAVDMVAWCALPASTAFAACCVTIQRHHDKSNNEAVRVRVTLSPPSTTTSDPTTGSDHDDEASAVGEGEKEMEADEKRFGIVVVVPAFSWLWSSLLPSAGVDTDWNLDDVTTAAETTASTLLEALSVPPGDTVVTVAVLEQMSALIRLHEQVYLPFSFATEMHAMTRCVAVAVAQHECSGGQCIRQGPWRAHECVHFMKDLAVRSLPTHSYSYLPQSMDDCCCLSPSSFFCSHSWILHISALGEVLDTQSSPLSHSQLARIDALAEYFLKNTTFSFEQAADDFRRVLEGCHCGKQVECSASFISSLRCEIESMCLFFTLVVDVIAAPPAPTLQLIERSVGSVVRCMLACLLLVEVAMEPQDTTQTPTPWHTRQTSRTQQSLFRLLDNLLVRLFHLPASSNPDMQCTLSVFVTTLLQFITPPREGERQGGKTMPKEGHEVQRDHTYPHTQQSLLALQALQGIAGVSGYVGDGQQGTVGENSDECAPAVAVPMSVEVAKFLCSVSSCRDGTGANGTTDTAAAHVHTEKDDVPDHPMYMGNQTETQRGSEIFTDTDDSKRICTSDAHHSDSSGDEDGVDEGQWARDDAARAFIAAKFKISF